MAAATLFLSNSHVGNRRLARCLRTRAHARFPCTEVDSGDESCASISLWTADLRSRLHGVAVGVGVGVSLGVSLGLGVGVSVGVGVGVNEGDGVGVGVSLGVGVGVGVTVGVGVGVGFEFRVNVAVSVTGPLIVIFTGLVVPEKEPVPVPLQPVKL